MQKTLCKRPHWPSHVGSCCWDAGLEQGTLDIKVTMGPQQICLYLSLLSLPLGYASFNESWQCFGPCLMRFSKWHRFLLLTKDILVSFEGPDPSFQKSSVCSEFPSPGSHSWRCELSPSNLFSRALTGVKGTQHSTKGAQNLKRFGPKRQATAEGWDKTKIFPASKTRPERLFWQQRTNFPF